MSDKLKPCPFCGNEKLSIVKDSLDYMLKTSSVLCKECCTKGRLHNWNTRDNSIVPSNFIKIETYEDCPCDVQLYVWTGDGYDVEYVDLDPETGVYYPANGVDFTHYIELPDTDVMERLSS